MTTDRPVIRDIITKAVCGNGTYKYLRSIDLEIPVSHKAIQVLGNFVSNSAVEEAVVVDKARQGKTVQVKGRYDIHVWYAYDQDTKAAKTTVTFIEYIPINTYGGESVTDQAANVKILQKPRCTKAYVKNLGDKTVIRVEIEQTLAAEVIGITKLKVGIVPGAVSAGNMVVGKELVPPAKEVPGSATAGYNYYIDLKCEEELPDDEFEYSFNDYDA